MAMPGITCPEKFVIPLYFKPKEQGDLSKLFQKDSILEHLFDPWKPEAVKAITYEDSCLLKYMHSHFLSLKSPIFAVLKQYKDRFSSLSKHLVSEEDIYSVILQESFMKNLTSLDNDIMINVLKYYAVLEEHKRLTHLKYEHIKTAISLKTEIEKLSRRITELSHSLNFETCSGIKITKLDPNSQQFSRCDKAICDNIKAQSFKDTPFSSIKLCVAFKIDNSHLLKSFEKKLKTSENSMLKGLFISISKKQVPTVTIFGLQTGEFMRGQAVSAYFKTYCRLPYEFIGKTKTESFLKASEGFPSEITASSFSTLSKDEKKLGSNSNAVIILVLCRSIISKSKADSGFNPETQEYKLSDLTCVYPEYILICTKEKTNFEIVPQKHCIIPVKLTDLSYSSPTSNKMTIDNFYANMTKAAEQSQLQRAKLKSETIAQIDGFWNNKNSKQALTNVIVESKKKFTEKLKSEIENLRKELAGHQRHTEALRQIKNIRCRAS